MISPYHVYPLDDLREHQTDSELCWCNPKVVYEDGQKIVVHNSMDQRELYEQEELKKH